MHFDLDDEQTMLKNSIDGFFADQLPEQRLMTLFDGDGALDAALWKGAVEIGIPGIMVPEDDGGAGMDLLALAAVAESAGYHAAPIPLANAALAAWAVAAGGSPAQKERWLPKLLDGSCLAAFAFNERGDRWQPAQWTLAGERLCGEKCNVERGAEAGLLIVGLAGGVLGLVDTAAGGVTCNAIDAVDRTRPLHHVQFDGAACEPLGADAALADRLRDALLIVHAADAWGAGKRALDMAVAYAGTRQQFGRLIGSFQALKHQLANMAVEIEPARFLAWYAAHAWDAIPTDAARAAALAKSHLTEVAVKTARAAVEAHGGIGYTWQYALHAFLKRAMHDRAVLGAPSVHRERALQFALAR
ncbi:MAG: acyl-CoA dehydrogenase family protein [Gammaproteobacteria bacterium]